MIKKASLILFMMAVMLCGGCWNYRGLNEMSIVAGLSFDIDHSTGLYKVSFQVVDLMGNVKVEGINAEILESEGKTLFDACRNAKKAIVGKLYFGHTQLVVISDELAREKDLRSLIDWMLHDAEIRETLRIVISKEKTAEEILQNETLVSPIIAFDVSKYIDDDNDVTASTSNKQLYEVFNALQAEGLDVTLPAMCNFESAGQTIPRLCGTAVFKEQRLAGYLSTDESKYFLFAVDQVKGGLLTLPSDGEGNDDTSLEISQNKTSRSFTYKDGKLVIKLAPETDVFLAESEVDVDAMDAQQIKILEKNAAATLAQRMVQTIQMVQSKFDADIFGFGSFIHQTDNALWQQIGKNWNEVYRTLEVQVSAKVNIVNSSCVKE